VGHEATDPSATDGPDPDEPAADPDQRREAEFRAFFERNFVVVSSFVLRRATDLALDVEDVVAETFVVAWRQAELPEPSGERVWLYSVARRVIWRHRRAAARRLRLTRLLSAERARTSDESSGSTDADRVRDAVAHLRPRDREALRLVLWEELTHEEAAAVLGCSVNALAVRLHRARRRLRELDTIRPLLGREDAPNSERDSASDDDA